MLKLLHTADWQIGRTYSLFDEDDAAALAEARFAAVQRIAALASEHAVDAVLVAGDVFDAQGVLPKTIRRLFAAMAGYAGPWLLIPGNHDAGLPESVWSHARRLDAIPPNVTVCLQPQPLEVAGKFVLLPAPLTQRHTHLDVTSWFDDAPTTPGLPRIGLAHGCVSGILAEGIDSANPIAAGRAAAAGLDYLALGDWHGTRQVDQRTWYAGTPETERFRANQSGQALLVTLEGAGALPQVQPLATGEYRWQQLEFTLSGASDLDAVWAALEAVDGRTVLQLRLQGACDLATQKLLQQRIARASATARALVADLDALRLAPTAEDLAALRADGFVGEVLRELRAGQAGPDAALAGAALLQLARVLDELDRGADA